MEGGGGKAGRRGETRYEESGGGCWARLSQKMCTNVGLYSQLYKIVQNRGQIWP